MDHHQFWKNFTLGNELHIAGRFIFNGLRSFHEMETLQNEDEVFEVLYHLSVGLERLLKVAVVLAEHDATMSEEEFEKSLITHSHLDLLARIPSKHGLTLAGPHNDFLQMLGVFYKTHRYGRYGVGTILIDGGEKRALHLFFEKHLKLTISDDQPFQVTRNDRRMKKFLGKIVGKISEQLFNVISTEASRLQIYTTEIRNGSKAEKIFIAKNFDFEDEDVLVKELLIFLMHSTRTRGHIGIMKGMEPLTFDPELEADYIQCLISDEKKVDVLGELEAIYDDLENRGQRLDQLAIIGNPNVYFDSDEELDDNDDLECELPEA